MPALYKSREWLRRQYLINKRTPESIAQECGVSLMTVYRYLRQFGFIK